MLYRKHTHTPERPENVCRGNHSALVCNKCYLVTIAPECVRGGQILAIVSRTDAVALLQERSDQNSNISFNINNANCFTIV